MRKILISVVLFSLVCVGISFAGDIIGQGVKQATMTVQFANGQKIINHPSGVVSVYTQEDLARFRAELVKQVNRLNDEIAQLDEDTSSAAATTLIVTK